MFVCAVCGADDGREELVEEVFNIEGRRFLVEGVPCMALCTMWRAIVQAGDGGERSTEAAW